MSRIEVDQYCGVGAVTRAQARQERMTESQIGDRVQAVEPGDRQNTVLEGVKRTWIDMT